MTIQNEKFVSINYTLKDANGKIIDSSVETSPLNYIHGKGYLIFGLENELNGKSPGDKFSCEIQPKDGYGEYEKNLVFTLEREKFEFDGEITVGMQFQTMSEQGPIILRVTQIDGDKIKVDGNHELAGKVLYFDIEVLEVRDATEDELNPKGCCSGNCGGCGGDCDCGENCDCEGDCN